MGDVRPEDMARVHTVNVTGPLLGIQLHEPAPRAPDESDPERPLANLLGRARAVALRAAAAGATTGEIARAAGLRREPARHGAPRRGAAHDRP